MTSLMDIMITVLTTIGIFYTFAPHRIHIASGIGFGLPHSNHVMAGIAMLVSAMILVRRRIPKNDLIHLVTV